MNEIMKMIYNAMWDYNYHVKLNVSDELLARKRAYIKGLTDMLRCYNTKCVVLYKSHAINSKITDIVVDDMSVTAWHESEVN